MLRSWVHRTIAADPAAAWHLLIDLDAWPQWGPTVRAASLDDPAGGFVAGATGRVTTSVGVTLPFLVDDLDPGREWSWRVGGVPATAHTVEPARDGSSCRVGFGVPLAAMPYLAVCAVALHRIDRLLTPDLAPSPRSR